MSLYKEDHYSFSTLQQFEQCPYSFLLNKIEGEPSQDNAFAQYGTLMHNIIDGWAQKQIAQEDMADTFDALYDERVKEPWPRILAVKGYDENVRRLGREYLEAFDGFKDYEIVASEKYFSFDLNGRNFVGIIDMILKDREGNICLLDHKSKTMAAFKSSKDKMYRQLYLYSQYIKNEFGVFPDKLMFNLFKEKEIVSQPFEKKEFIVAKDWAVSIMKKIESFTYFDFLTTHEDRFFCENLCNVRDCCKQ